MTFPKWARAITTQTSLWLPWRSTQTSSPSTITITLTADTTKFDDAMLNVAEQARVYAHRRAIAYERILGHARISVLLDDWCRSYDWDPVQVWRLPRQREFQGRTWYGEFGEIFTTPMPQEEPTS